MKKSVTSFLLGGVLGTALGVAIGFFVFPYVFPPPEAVETLIVDEASARVATGRFIHANPSDPVHYGSGKVSVYEGTVFLEADFEVGAGPDFHVYLVAAATIRDAAAVEGTQYVDLGKLRAFKGSHRATTRGHQTPERTDHLPLPARRGKPRARCIGARPH